MNALEKLQNKPRHERTPIESCIVDAAIFEEAEHDGEVELMEQAAEDLADYKKLLNEIQNAITFETEEQAEASPYGLPSELANKIRLCVSSI